MTNLNFFCGALIALLLVPVHSLAQENFANAWPSVDFYTKNKVIVSVSDEREYIKSGKKDLSYVGVRRNNYGIPFSLYTPSSEPLSVELEKAINSGLSNSGIDASIADAKTKASLKTTASDEKLLVIRLSEWVSDSHASSHGFVYKLTADVYDFKGIKIATASSEGEKTVRSILEGGREALSQLLLNKEIVSSLVK